MIINGIEKEIASLANLQRADLRQADLRGVNLQRANLWKANLWKADLREANLQGADLREADLRGVNLQRADLREANLQRADLWGADLRGVNLQRADLREANLQRADLREANLQGADLWEANLWGMVFSGTNISQIKRDDNELNAERRLKEIITSEQFESYFNYGYFNEGQITVSINELVLTPKGVYCLEIKSPDLLPRADRIIHRLLLYRHNKEEFFKMAKKIGT